VRCQLLASEFYEALKREGRHPTLNAAERRAVIAAENQCLHATNASITLARRRSNSEPPSHCCDLRAKQRRL
jgi:hypothetical protein